MSKDIKTVSVTKQVEEAGSDGRVWVDEYTLYAVRQPSWDYYQRDADGKRVEKRVNYGQAVFWKVDGTTLEVSSKQGALDYIELLQKIVAEYEADEQAAKTKETN